MATKKFTKNAQRVFNKNPNVLKCTQSKITFTDEFVEKVIAAIKAGEDPYKVFTDNGISLRILGKTRAAGAIGLWRSKYGLEGLPRRQVARGEKKHIETTQERHEREMNAAIAYCDDLINNPSKMDLDPSTDADVIKFNAIKKTYESDLPVIVKNLCTHYGYDYQEYYQYWKSINPKQSSFVNILNPHRKE